MKIEKIPDHELSLPDLMYNLAITSLTIYEKLEYVKARCCISCLLGSGYHPPKYFDAIRTIMKYNKREIDMKENLKRQLRKARQNLDTKRIGMLKRKLGLHVEGQKKGSIVCSTD